MATLAATSALPLRHYVCDLPTTMTTNFTGIHGCGFMNQHSKLLVLLTLAIYMHADVVRIPRSVYRNHFLSNRPVWQEAPPQALWDVPSIKELLSRHGVAMQLNHQNHVEPCTIFMPAFHVTILPIETAETRIRKKLRDAWDGVKACPNPTPKGVTMLFPDLIGALQTKSLGLYTEVAHSVRFAPFLYHVAASFIRHEVPEGRFNGVHLRVEADMLGISGLEGHVQWYTDSMRALNFTKVPMLIASGVFTDKGSERLQKVETWLRDVVVGGGLASRIIRVSEVPIVEHAEHAAHAPRLNLEQRAAVDFLVLMHADKFVGHFQSSFSASLVEFRAMEGISRSTSMLGFGDKNGFQRCLGVSENLFQNRPSPSTTEEQRTLEFS